MRFARLVVVIAMVLAAESLPVRGGERAVFKEHPAKELVSAMAMTEDGRCLVLGHEKANKVTFWDVVTGKKREDVQTNIARLMKHFEGWILDRPDQWWWISRVWDDV